MADDDLDDRIIPFRPARRPRPFISIWPSAVDDGCWAVDLVHASGDSAALLGYFMDLREAKRAARRWAVEYDAEFESPEGGS
jgi:hypothetical protein